MKVSVIIPIYKVEEYVEACLASISIQKHKDLEIILVNDCSPDNSMQLAKHYVTQRGLRDGMEVKYLEHDHNRGLSAARNTGINAATGDYVFFLDSDDELAPDGISSLIEPLQKKQYDFVVGDYAITDDISVCSSLQLDEGEIIGNKNILSEYCQRSFYMMAWGKLYKMSFIRNNGLLFQEGLIHEDELWSMQVALSAGSMYIVRRPVYLYRRRNDSITERESKRDKIANYLPVLGSMNSVICKYGNDLRKDLLSLIGNYYDRFYISAIYHGWYDAYLELRKLDPRTYLDIVRLCLSSRKSIRTNGHLLLPSKIGFSLYGVLLRKFLD